MDVTNEEDPPKNQKKKDDSNSDIIKILESLDERINKLEINMKSLMLMNEDMTMKLQISSEKETQQNDLNRVIMEKIFKIENSFPKNMKEINLNTDTLISKLKDIEKRTRALETEKSVIKENGIIKNSQDNIYVLLKFDNKNNINMLERILKRKKDMWDLQISKDNDEEFKIFDIEWYKRNLPILADKCSTIIMNNVEVLDIEEDIIFTNNIIFTSNPETNLNFKNNSSIMIEGKLEFNNINIMNCNYGDKILIEIKEGSNLEFNNGFIENNRGDQCLFGVKENALLNLNKTIFNNNIQLQKNYTSCIFTDKKADVYINECEFLNHNSTEYPFSSRLIQVDGNLSILSSKFKNNKLNISKWACVYCDNGNFNLNEVKFENCSFIELRNCHYVNIKNSIFMNNSAIDVVGGSISVKESKNVKIEECTFKNNETNYGGGSLNLYKCKNGNNYIRNCIFRDNHVRDKWHGGAICFSESEIHLENNTFYNNSTEGYGGALIVESSDISCGNCTFECNFAKKVGGAICVFKNSNFTQLDSNRFISNVASDNTDISRFD